MRRFLTASVILFLAFSCRKGDEPLFAIQGAFLTAVNGTLYGDSGESYVPSSNPGVDLNSGRYFVTGYATEDWGNQKYKMQVSSISPVTLSEVLTNSKIEDQDKVGHDAIQPLLGYAGGKYLNLRIEYLFKDETVKHSYNLVFDDAKSNKDTLFFNLRHQANKDTLAAGKEMKAFYNYDSFDISSFSNKEKNQMVVILRGKWYTTGSSGYLPTLSDYESAMSYKY